MDNNTLRKEERLRSKILIERLFQGGSKSFSIFPLRVVYLPVEKDRIPSAAVLISVPKKRFKRAVHRNRIKRLIRECYRTHKQELLQLLENKEEGIIISFIYLSADMPSYECIERKMKTALNRLVENVS